MSDAYLIPVSKARELAKDNGPDAWVQPIVLAEVMKINNKIVSIDYKLRTGDICEILTQKEEHPNRAWIDICKTASAKSKIRQWFKHEKRDENIVEGKAMIEREFKRQGMNLTEEEYPEFFRSVSVKKQYNTLDDFYAAVGYGGIQLWKIMPRLREEFQKTYASDLESITVPPVPEKRSKASSGVIIEGNDDVLVKFSNCCNPLPGDEIIGYITRGRGVSVHRRDCISLKDRAKFLEKIKSQDEFASTACAKWLEVKQWLAPGYNKMQFCPVSST